MFHVRQTSVKSAVRQAFKTIQVDKTRPQKDFPWVYLPKFQYYSPIRSPKYLGLDAWELERSAFLIRRAILPDEVKDRLRTIGTAFDVAIWLFMHANDLHSVITLLNELSTHGIPVPLTTLMTASRGSQTLKTVGYTHELVFAVKAYQPLQPPEWIPSPGVYTQIIIAFAECKDMKALSKSNTATVTEIDDSVAWQGSLDQSKIFNPGRFSLECGPYRSYMRGLLHDSMKEDNVEADTEFCNTPLEVYQHSGLFHQAIAGYNRMIKSTRRIIPDAYTYVVIFVVLGKVFEMGHSYNAQTGDFFREMITLDMIKTSTVAAKIRDEIVSRSSLNSALRMFLRVRDYSAALVVLQVLKKYDYLLKETLERAIARILGFRLLS
ncbi:hypothetical protein M422DRAFT_24789, partial [Sphaerobolus stellatus SS14]